MKHSQASQCRIAIESMGNEWRLEVADDGVGLHSKEEDGDEALSLIALHQPDVCLLDIEMPAPVSKWRRK